MEHNYVHFSFATTTVASPTTATSATTTSHTTTAPVAVTPVVLVVICGGRKVSYGVAATQVRVQGAVQVLQGPQVLVCVHGCAGMGAGQVVQALAPIIRIQPVLVRRELHTRRALVV